MPSPSELSHSRPMRRRAISHRGIAVPAPARDQEESPALAWLNLLRDHWRLAAAIAGVVTLLALAYAVLARPVYEASMLIHVEEATPSTSKNALNDVASMFDTKKAVTAEMELLRSRTVIAPAVERLNLTIDARPDYFPLLGKLVRDARPGQLSQPGLFGWGGAVWGAEQIEVPVLNVPPAMYNRALVITSMGGGRFSVLDPAGSVMFYGAVGPLLHVATPSGGIDLQVARLAGQPGARFLVKRSSASAAIRKLQDEMLVAERGKQSGVIEVRLEGGSAEMVNAVLRDIAQQYMAQNIGRKSEEAEKSLAFLDQQLPKLKAKLERAEGEYNAYRNAHGTIDFAEEAKLSLQQAAAARLRRTDLFQKRTELLTRFTLRHPVVAAVTGQLRQVDQELADIARHIKTLPLLEQDSVRMARDIKLNTDLYTALANTAQQLRIVSVGKVSNVRMVDPPMVSDDPVRPHRRLIVAIGLGCGLLLGALGAVVRKNLGGAVDDPLAIEKLLGARVVVASIPHSDAQARLCRRGGATGGAAPLLARDWPTDGAIEALRSFRASLQFSMPRLNNNVIMFAGPTSSLGKSFVSVNFAVVMAAAGKRVLLVDGDVRNGRLHQYFGVPREGGLCEAVSGAITLGQAIRHGVLDRLDLVTTGVLAAARPDFFMPLDVGALLGSVRSHYDLVLVDSPPILALADSLVIGGHAGAVFLVVRAGVSTEREITESIKRLNQAGVSPLGIVFNDVKPRLSGYGYKYAYRPVGQLEFAA
jgi:tyrosine-protein kinase Etk/Wzc